MLAEERTGIEQLQADAQASGDQRRQEVTDEVAAERRMQLDLLPSDLAGTVQGLQSYEFVSSEARQHFEELMERSARRWPRPTSTRCPRPCPTPTPSSWPACATLSTPSTA